MKHNRRFLFFLGHPAHFHLFKNSINELIEKDFEVNIVIKTKDILVDLCKSENWDVTNILIEYRKNNVFSMANSFLKKYMRISKIIKNFKPTILLGSEPTLAHLGKVFKIPSVIFSEDDVEIIAKFAKITYPFVDVILSPKVCNAGNWENKKIPYNGFHKLAYLHPSVFTPNRDLLKEYLPENYFILRLTELKAYHDTNKKGIDKPFLKEIIHLLEPFGKVYITSESKLEKEFEKYQLKLPSQLIHHALYFAKMYIGDSQSMAVESALLGTPSIRFNDFVGKISVLNELEFSYELTFGFKTNQKKEMLEKIKSILTIVNYEEKFKTKRIVLLKEKINVPEFFYWFITNYPESKVQMQNNPDYQYNFK